MTSGRVLQVSWVSAADGAAVAASRDTVFGYVQPQNKAFAAAAVLEFLASSL